MKIIEEIKKMDRMSNEFFQVYLTASRKYWDLTEEQNKSGFLVSAKMLNTLSNSNMPELVMSIASMADILHKMIEGDSNNFMGQIEMDKFHIVFSFDKKDNKKKLSIVTDADDTH